MGLDDKHPRMNPAQLLKHPKLQAIWRHDMITSLLKNLFVCIWMSCLHVSLYNTWAFDIRETKELVTSELELQPLHVAAGRGQMLLNC